MLASAPLPVEERLLRMAALMTDSTQRVMRSFGTGASTNSTGFVAYNPAGLCRLVLKLLRILGDRRPASLDLGCGNGGWTLMAAAAGFPSYGVDISSFLVGHARRNCRTARQLGFINPDTDCEFAVGDMFPAEYRNSGLASKSGSTTPTLEHSEMSPYDILGVTVRTAGIVYAYAWPVQMPALCQFLADTVQPDTILVLPVYSTGDYNQHLKIKSLDPNEKHFCIGTKA